jgi:hypothetical protein
LPDRDFSSGEHLAKFETYFRSNPSCKRSVLALPSRSKTRSGSGSQNCDAGMVSVRREAKRERRAKRGRFAYKRESQTVFQNRVLEALLEPVFSAEQVH